MYPNSVLGFQRTGLPGSSLGLQLLNIDSSTSLASETVSLRKCRDSGCVLVSRVPTKFSEEALTGLTSLTSALLLPFPIVGEDTVLWP